MPTELRETDSPGLGNGCVPPRLALCASAYRGRSHTRIRTLSVASNPSNEAYSQSRTHNPMRIHLGSGPNSAVSLTCWTQAHHAILYFHAYLTYSSPGPSVQLGSHGFPLNPWSPCPPLCVTAAPSNLGQRQEVLGTIDTWRDCESQVSRQAQKNFHLAEYTWALQ